MTKPLSPQDISIILVRPRYGGNIGSTARVMKNMGFSKLIVVRPTVLPTHPEALRLAVGAADLLQKTVVCDTLEEAAKGLNYTIGTSRRVGKNRQDFISLPEISTRLGERQKIGILFGAEERGLTNKELAICNLVVMIPSDPDFGSLNLAQSVAVTTYQLRLFFLSKMDDPDLPQKKKTAKLASVEEIEGMYGHLERALTDIEFLIPDNTFHMMRSLRGIFGRTGLTDREVRILRGISRQIEYVNSKRKL
ncbi:MAG: RNA methyltransferase [Deltaproteobacteria bacterium]|nr:MAG: RNA methyltransferase [Deltaproteobacteria bacterium]